MKTVLKGLGVVGGLVFLGGLMSHQHRSDLSDEVPSVKSEFTSGASRPAPLDIQQHVPESIRGSDDFQSFEKLLSERLLISETDRSGAAISFRRFFPDGERHHILKSFDYESVADKQAWAQEKIRSGFRYDSARQDYGHFLEFVHVCEAINYEGHTQEEKAFLDQAVLSYEPSQRFKEWREGGLQECLKLFASDPEIIAAVNSWKAPADYESVEDAEAQYFLKLKLCQHVSDTVRGFYGLKKCDLYIMPLDDDILVKGLFASVNSGAIVLNSASARGVFDKPDFEFFRVLFEEVMHSVDDDFIYQFAYQDSSPANIHYEHSFFCMLNFLNKVDGVSLKKAPPVAYAQQYIERTAKEASLTLSYGVQAMLMSAENGAFNASVGGMDFTLGQ